MDCFFAKKSELGEIKGNGGYFFRIVFAHVASDWEHVNHHYEALSDDVRISACMSIEDTD